MALDDPHRQPSEPCGRLLGRVWEQTQDGASAADPHTGSCPHCREAVEGPATADAATRALRAVDPPGLHALADPDRDPRSRRVPRRRRSGRPPHGGWGHRLPACGYRVGASHEEPPAK